MYILLPIFMILAFFAGTFLLGSTMTPLAFVDIPSLVVMALITFGSLIAGKKLKALVKAFRPASIHTDSELKECKTAISYLIKSIWCAGIFSFIFGMIAFLNSMNQDRLLVTALAQSLCSLLYASVSHILLLPLQSKTTL